jgi:hypothetical protein
MISGATDQLDSKMGVPAGLQSSDCRDRATPVRRWLAFLEAPVDGASLAVFRICFAACMIVNQTLFGAKFMKAIAEPTFHFSYIPGMPVPSPDVMQILLVAMTILAGLIGLGWLYRPACALFFLSYTYLFLCEKILYQNHAYLTCLLSFWFFLAPANRVFALDNYKGKLPGTVPRWSVLIFKLQIAIVYFFAGITKLNPEWLRGQPQTAWLQESAGLPVLGPIVSQPWFAVLVTFGGITVDLSMGFLLFARRTFVPAALVALSFHLLNSYLWRIDFFPWFMIATIGLFAPYDWPRRVLSAIGVGSKTSPVSNGVQSQTDQSESAGQSNIFPDRVAQSLGDRPWNTSWQRRVNAGILIFFHVYLLVQLLVPLRRFLYPGDMNWTNQGHRFCWSMMARKIHLRKFVMTAINPSTKVSEEVDWQDFLDYRQFQYMAARPDMILQYSLYVADKLEKQWGVRPVIHVKCAVKFNDHRSQLLIDPKVDLAAQKPSLANQSWILPLRN